MSETEPEQTADSVLAAEADSLAPPPQSLVDTVDPEAPTPDEIRVEAERIKRAEKERSDRALDHIAEIMVEMSKTDAWQQMERILNEQETVIHGSRLQALMDGEALSQRDLDEDRGKIKGLRVPMLIIARAHQRLEDRDKRQPEEAPPDLYAERTYWD